MKRLFLSLFCVSILYCGHAFSQSVAKTPATAPAAIAPSLSATPAPLENAVQNAVGAAVSAAKQSLLSSVSLTPSLIAQVLALQALFGSLLSGLQKLFTSASLTPQGAVPSAPSLGQKIAGALLWVVKLVGVNL